MAGGIRGVLRSVKAAVRPDDFTRARRRLARQYLRGAGLEVGALHHPLPVPAAARVRYVDRMSVPDLRKHYPDLAAEPLVPVDVVDDGEQLATVADGSQDYLIANHFLEHTEDPIGTLTTFLRVVAPGGVVYLAVPDKRFTFDRDRPVTPLAHLLADHADGPAASRRGHYEEYARLVLRCPDAEFGPLVEHLMAVNHSIHFHVWTQAGLFELIAHLQPRLGFDVEAACKNGHEVIFVLRKHGP